MNAVARAIKEKQIPIEQIERIIRKFFLQKNTPAPSFGKEGSDRATRP